MAGKYDIYVPQLNKCLLINTYKLLIVWEPNKTEKYIYILFIDKFIRQTQTYRIYDRSK